MDFVADGLGYGRRFRCLNIVDDYTRECLAVEVDTSQPGLRVASVLERLAEMRGLPRAITVDNGPEFASRALDAWAYRTGVTCRSFDRASPWRMPISKASTASSATNASTSIGSCCCGRLKP